MNGPTFDTAAVVVVTAVAAEVLVEALPAIDVVEPVEELLARVVEVLVEEVLVAVVDGDVLVVPCTFW